MKCPKREQRRRTKEEEEQRQERTRRSKTYQIHDKRFMYLLPQVRSEDLNQRNFQSWNFAVHENSSQIQLHLESDVDVRSVNRRRPPQRETTVWNLVQTRPLRVGELLELHRVFETRRFFPK